MRVAPSLLAATLLLGCAGRGNYHSPDLATGDISMSASVTSGGVTASFNAGIWSGEDFWQVDITPPDRLLFGPPGDYVEVQNLSGSYIAKIDTTALDFEIVLDRGGERVVSPMSLPPAFEITPPPDPVSRAAPIVISWGAAEGPYTIEVRLTSPCAAGFTRTLQSDPGQYTIQPADLSVVAPSGVCGFTVQVTRTRDEIALSPELGPAPHPGHTSQVRSVYFVTMP